MTQKVRVQPSYVDYAIWYNGMAANARLGALLQVEGERETVNKRENLLREIALSYEDAMDILETNLEHSPAGVWFVSSLLHNGMNNNQINTESFREFADKDRIRNLRKRLSDLLEKSGEMMYPDECDRLNKCLDWCRDKLPDLEKLRMHYQALEDIERTTASKAPIINYYKSREQWYWRGVSISFISICVSVPVYGFVENSDAYSDLSPYVFYWSLALALAAVVFFFLYLHSRKNKKINEIRSKLADIRKNVLSKNDQEQLAEMVHITNSQEEVLEALSWGWYHIHFLTGRDRGGNLLRTSSFEALGKIKNQVP